MGTYASVAVRDAGGNIIGYQSTSTGLPTETASTAYQQALKQAGYVNQNVNASGSAADIASSISRTGGAVDINVARKAIAEGVSPSQVNVASNLYTDRGTRVNVPVSELAGKNIGVETGRLTTPTRDLSIAASMTPVLASKAAANLTTVDFGVGAGQSVKLREAQIIGDYNTGEFGVYQKSYSGGKERMYLSLVGGGGRNALQSGAFAYGDDSLSPESKTYEQWDTGKIVPLSASYFEKYSGRGSEVYGGKSGILLNANKTVESTGAKLSTYTDTYNLATLANPQGVNAPKSENAGLNFPLSKTASESAITILNYGTKGNVLEVKDTSGLAASQKVQAGSVSPSTAYDLTSTLPKPYTSKVSTATPSLWDVSKSIIGIGVAKAGEAIASTGLPKSVGAVATGVSDISSKFLEGTIFAPKESKGTNATSESSKITVSGGNATITALDTWINANTNKIDATNATQVEEFNKNVGTYNLMSKQNPVVTSTETTSTTANKIVTGSGEKALLSGLYDTAGKTLGGIIGGSWAASALTGKPIPTTSTDILAPKRGTTGLVAGFATVPGGSVASSALGRYGIPIAGAVAAAAIGKSALDTGFDLSSQPGVQKAQELWEGAGRTIQLPTAPTMPSISDVIPTAIYNAPGKGYEQIVSLPGEGYQIIAGLPGVGRELIAKTEGAISLPFGGGNSVIQMPKSTILPSDVITPISGYSDVSKGVAANVVASDRALYDLSVDVAGKAITKTEESVRSASDYSTKLAEIATTGVSVATPYWWTRASNLAKVTDKATSEDATQYGNAAINRVTTKDLVTTIPSAYTDITTLNPVTTKTTTQTIPRTTYDIIDTTGKGTPQYDLKRRDLTWPGGSGGSGGEARGGSYRFTNIFNVGFGVGSMGMGMQRSGRTKSTAPVTRRNIILFPVARSQISHKQRGKTSRTPIKF
jgi:hypothetical protein